MSIPLQTPSQLTADELRSAAPGAIYRHYSQFIEWLIPSPNGKGCQGPWVPITEKWTSGDTESLWKKWDKLLPLFLDPTVEEIWVQQIPRHPTNPTPNDCVDVLSDGFSGVRVHHALRMPISVFMEGFRSILNSSNRSLYSIDRPEGVAIIQSALECDGVRLAGGVPPISKAPFAAIRIPARIRPQVDHVSGALAFGKGIDWSLQAPGEPLTIPAEDPLGRSRQIIAEGKAEGKVMIPLQALEYLQAAKLVGWNCIYSGATSSAKTTVLNAAINLTPHHWRVVTVETGVAELKVPHINWVPLFCDDSREGMRQADILKLAMRMSPKPIPNGEIRGAEGALFVEACLTGHEGSDTSLHAGSPDEAMMRLTRMVLSGSAGLLTEETARVQAAMAANIIVQMRRDDVLSPEGHVVSARRCVEIAEVHVEGSYTENSQAIRLVPIFTLQKTDNGMELAYTPRRSALWETLRKRLLSDKIPQWARQETA